MDINKMRNIVILKDLPSNLVDEAFVVLKGNQRIKKVEYADGKGDNFLNGVDKEDKDEYVVREAELLISNYINKIENQDFMGRNVNGDIVKKYKWLKGVTIFLSIAFIISLFVHV
ncbi:MAG: hypothetical protein IJ690_00760 [Clostridia bacterium]|nr:hypothetical protein [Clostridia bacterium]